MRALLEQVRSWLRPRQVDDEISREIQFHLDMEVERRVKAGQSEAEARRAATRDFGGTVQVREGVRDARRMTFVDNLEQDVRFGARTLARAPAHAAAAIAILALGIGANTAMFSVLNGVLFKPLPFSEPDDLVLIQQMGQTAPFVTGNVSIPELFEYRARLASISDLVEHHGMSFTLLNQGDPDRVDTGVVSANFFDMLGIRALHGRTFLPDEDTLGAEAVLVLSYRYWMDRFGGDPGVVGRVFEMNNRPHTVVGVLPNFPEYPRPNDVYMPTSACPFRSDAERSLPAGGHHGAFPFLTVVGRLGAGTTPERAGSELATVAQSFEAGHQSEYDSAGLSEFTARAHPLKHQLTENARSLTWLLSGVTLLVLLIACANVANLALTRTAQRQRELAVRAALGASRGRLVRQLLTESLLLALVGGVVGLVLACWSLDMLIDFVGRFTARTGQIDIDGTVLMYSLVAALASGLIFGIAPALSARRSLLPTMRSGDAQSSDGPGRRRVRGALVVAQVCVSTVLLVGAGLLIESAYRLASEPMGYQGDRVLTAAIFGNFSRVTTQAEAGLLNSRILERLRATPGVEAAASTNAVPQSNIRPGQTPFDIEGRAAQTGVRRVADTNIASDGYFETLQIPMVSGREIRPSDTAEATPVAVINESMARYWEGADPVGTRIRSATNPDAPWITIVGVAPDFRLYSADREREVPALIYTPVAQTGGFGGRLMIRTSGDPMTFAPALKAAVHGVDPLIPVEEVQTLADLRHERQASPRLTSVLLGLFAAVALVITLVGIAALIGTTVSQRTREFGIRMALGASPRSVLAMVVRQGVVLVLAGLVLGLAGASALSELLSAYLYETPPTDPSAYLAVAGVFMAAGVVACLGPARRATSIDPLTSLRSE
jgi:predicted permease